MIIDKICKHKKVRQEAGIHKNFFKYSSKKYNNEFIKECFQYVLRLIPKKVFIRVFENNYNIYVKKNTFDNYKILFLY